MKEKNDYMSVGPSAADKAKNALYGGTYIDGKYAELKRRAQARVVELLRQHNDGKHTFTISI